MGIRPRESVGMCQKMGPLLILLVAKKRDHHISSSLLIPSVKHLGFNGNHEISLECRSCFCSKWWLSIATSYANRKLSTIFQNPFSCVMFLLWKPNSIKTGPLISERFPLSQETTALSEYGSAYVWKPFKPLNPQNRMVDFLKLTESVALLDHSFRSSP